MAAKAGGANDLAESARRRLKLSGVGQRRSTRSSRPGRPYRGWSSARRGAASSSARTSWPGRRVEDGMTLLEIADLSAVWIEADVYEKDLAFVREGQAVEASVEAIAESRFPRQGGPGLSATGRGDANQPRAAGGGQPRATSCGPACTPRSASTCRLSKSNRSSRCRRNDAPLRIAAAADGRRVEEALAVPERAVIDTGAKQIVYIERQPGVFEGVEVQLGPRNGDYYAVAEGLSAGDRVAAAGAFLIDAETRLNPAAAATYFGARAGRSARPVGRPIARRKGDSRPPQRSVWTEEQLKNTRRACRRRSRPARTQGMPRHRLAAGVDGRAGEDHAQRPAVFLCCPGCVGSRQEAGRENRCKKPPNARKQAAMIEKIIEFSIRNRFVVILLSPGRGDLGRPRRHQYAGRRHSRPLGEPGDRLHRLDGPQPQGDRRPDHLSALGQPARAGGREGGAVVAASSTSR